VVDVAPPRRRARGRARSAPRRRRTRIEYARAIAKHEVEVKYEVTLSEHPTGPPASSSPWQRTVEASSRPEAVRLAEEVFRSETGREPLYVSVRALT
jgi:hypothetical protein